MSNFLRGAVFGATVGLAAIGCSANNDGEPKNPEVMSCKPTDSKSDFMTFTPVDKEVFLEEVTGIKSPNYRYASAVCKQVVTREQIEEGKLVHVLGKVPGMPLIVDLDCAVVGLAFDPSKLEINAKTIPPAKTIQVVCPVVPIAK